MAQSYESLIFDGLDLASGVTWSLESFDAPPPGKRVEWAQGADADGSALVRDPLFENRTITLRLRVTQQADMDTALAQVFALSKKIEECEQQPDGLGLVWTPANSTKSITFYVLSGAVGELPVVVEGDSAGWFVRSPVLTVQLACKPFGYGAAVTGSAVTSAAQLLTLTVPAVAGDVPAEARLIVTDLASQSRRYVEWGLESRWFTAGAPLSLQIQSSALVTTGFSATSQTRAGSVNTNVMRGVLFPSSTALVGLGNLGHVGTYRVKARVYYANNFSTGNIRLSWQDGDGPLLSNPFVALRAGWAEVDLGVVTINTAQLGTQKWTGRIEANSTNQTGDTLDIDYLLLIPVGEGYGRALASAAITTPGVVGAYDNFQNINDGSNLGGYTPTVGAAWVSAGGGTDFIGQTAKVQRSANTDASPRIAVLGSAITDCEVKSTVTFAASDGAWHGIVARYVDASNYARLYFRANGGYLTLEKVIAGVVTSIFFRLYGTAVQPGGTFILRFTASSNGTYYGEITSAGAVIVSSSGNDPVFATGGTLASGKGGILDYLNGGANGNRTWDDVTVSIPPAEQIVMYSGRAAEVRYDGVQRQDSTGTYYGPVPAYRGSRFLLPPSGDKARTSRVVVKAHRTNIEASDAINVTDNLQASVTYTPRFLVVPG